ncbi:hypothetical protein C8F01DRAFT_980121, partial [Mycena amicta]
ALQVSNWKKKGTETYTHYKLLPSIKIGDDSIVRYWFACERFPSKIVKRTCYDTSTSNLSNHIKTCAPGVNGIEKFTTGGDYNVGRFRLSIALWIAVHNRSHLAITDPELVAAFRTLQPNVHVPSMNVYTLLKPSREILEFSVAFQRYASNWNTA